MAYTLDQFVGDLDRITHEETDATTITERIARLLGQLVTHPAAIPAEYRRAPAGQRGRYMLHRSPRFNVNEASLSKLPPERIATTPPSDTKTPTSCTRDML